MNISRFSYINRQGYQKWNIYINVYIYIYIYIHTYIYIYADVRFHKHVKPRYFLKKLW